MKSGFSWSCGRGRVESLTFARLIPTPENRLAWGAVQQVVAAASADSFRSLDNPLFLHGPPGCGKTHLVSALAAELDKQTPTWSVRIRTAASFRAVNWQGGLNEDLTDTEQTNEQADVLIVEDLHQLAPQAAETVVRLIDTLLARRQVVVATALVGPGQLTHLPARLTSRLAAGLVVGIQPLAAPSRYVLLREFAQRRQLAVGADILQWLAQHLNGGGRQLQGAIARLDALSRHQPLDLAAVRCHFDNEVEANRPTIERIVQRVSDYFQVPLREIRSVRRSRDVLLPRQISMYLARQLTELSLEQIGTYFGDRDHATVLHACQKVENGLTEDDIVAGVVRELQAALT
ncbi:MAG: helix-turn-helix domain-containing protein [Gemmataceae bacterium]